MTHVLQQPTWVRLMAVAAGGALAVTALIVGVADGGGIAVAFSVTMSALIVAVAVRAERLRIEVDDREVRFINWLRVVRVPWTEVERFGGEGDVWVRRRDLRQHNAAAFAYVPGSLPFTRLPAQRAVASLEATRKKRRRQGGGRDRE